MTLYFRLITLLITWVAILLFPTGSTLSQYSFAVEDPLKVNIVPIDAVLVMEDLMYNEPSLVYKVEQKVFYSGNEEKRQVALTFDDGPDNYYTQQILDILQEHDIKATFFLIGSNVQRFPEVAERIANEGHIIGNHSWSHEYFTKISSNSMHEEVLKTEEILNNVVGNQHANIFRPPYGAYNQEVLEVIHSLEYNFVFWSVDTRDWANTPISSMVKTVSSQITPGGIILMHSSGSNRAMRNTVKALPEIIQTAKKLRYEFATVPEVLDLEIEVNHHRLREL